MCNYKIGFIGMGNMGSAILQGLLKNYNHNHITFSEVLKEKSEQIESETHIKAQSSYFVAIHSKILILAIKPQSYPIVLKEIKENLKAEQILISLAPNISIQNLKDILGEETRIVRAMPNTPALIGEGMTGLSYDDTLFSESEMQQIHNIFSSLGKVIKIQESLLPSVVAISGSAPAYVYLFIDALSDAGVRYGLSKDKALLMAAQTILGSAKMVLESGEHPMVLKDKVCSPGGTTIEAITKLEEYGFRNSIAKACQSCVEKCKNIS